MPYIQISTMIWLMMVGVTIVLRAVATGSSSKIRLLDASCTNFFRLFPCVAVNTEIISGLL